MNTKNERPYRVLNDELEQALNDGNITKEKLMEFVPILVRASEKITAMRRMIYKMNDLFAALNEKCGTYALEHQAMFIGKRLNLDGKGTFHGDIEIGDDVYHFAAGPKGLGKVDGTDMTEEFKRGLPDGWTKVRTELDMTGIKRLNVSDEDLLNHGLIRKLNHAWSLPASVEE